MIMPSPLPFARPDKYIHAEVVLKDPFRYEDNIWPDRFLFAPKRGDTIESEDGRRLDVLSVVHTMRDESPFVIIEVGVDKSEVTPMEGGGQDVIGEFA